MVNKARNHYVIIGHISGLCRGSYRDTGKENGSYYLGLRVKGLGAYGFKGMQGFEIEGSLLHLPPQLHQPLLLHARCEGLKV